MRSRPSGHDPVSKPVIELRTAPNRQTARLVALAAFALIVGPAATLWADDPNLEGELLAPKAFKAAVDRVVPSLVTIETYGGVSRPSGRTRGGPTQGISKPGDGPTTGLIISDDGYIITSTFNFIRKPQIITVIFPDGSQRLAKLLGRDNTRGVCLLKVDGVSGLSVPEFVPRQSLRVGQWAISVGVGYGGERPAMSAGIISATSRISGRAVQTDANTSPANYGGPLVDIEGRVIGICAPLSPQAGNELAGVAWYDSGIGFAVPVHGNDKVIAAMKEGKTVQPGKVGIVPAPVDMSGGVKITKVLDGSPADKAGVQVDDQVISVDGEKIIDVTQLRTVLGRYVAGEKIKLLVKRGEEEKEFELTLGAGSDQPQGRGPRPMIVPKPADKDSSRDPFKQEQPGEDGNAKKAEPKSPDAPAPEKPSGESEDAR